jgi:hypothetical protein
MLIIIKLKHQPTSTTLLTRLTRRETKILPQLTPPLPSTINIIPCLDRRIRKLVWRHSHNGTVFLV